MNWELILHKENTGKFNMEFDIALAQNFTEDKAYFRLYRWKPYAISLGANQNEDEINKQFASKDGIDIVKRPTGGRAILHSEELTYSVVLPAAAGLSSKEIYNKISLALVNGLKLYDGKMSELELENLQPNFPQLLKQPNGMICFASTARHEVKYKGRKLIGSAQRKMNGVILQHGSILCGDFHLKLPEYLNIDDETKAKLKIEMNQKTVSIGQILSEKIDYPKLYESLIKGFEKTWNIVFNEKPNEVLI